MMRTYPVAVSGSGLNEKKVRRRLRRYGLADDGIEFSGQVTKRKQKKIKKYCEETGLLFRLTNALGRRRADYRKLYFKSKEPDLGKRYICVYCGKLLKKEKVSVDHLYPVGKASRDVRLQEKLERKGIRNINDPKNLVAACHSCNSKKANRMGIWILRGRLGRHRAYWLFLCLLSIVTIAWAAICLTGLFPA